MQSLLGNPFNSRRKNFKSFARARATHRHTAVIIIKSSPTNSQKAVKLKLNLFAPGSAQGPDIFPPPLAVICCLSCSCPCVPSLSVSLLLHSAIPGSFGSASVSFPLRLPSKGNSTVIVHFFSQDMSNPVPSLPSHLLAYWVCSCHLQHFLVCDMLLPSDAVDSSEAVTLRSNGSDSKSILDICFGHKTAMANSFDGTNRIFNCSVRYTGQFRRNAIV